MPSAVALIPARQGSKRVPGKNVRLLHGHPTIAYTIAPALESGVFESVIVSTDSEEIAEVARHYGAEVPFLRPAAFASDTSPDIEWLGYTLRQLAEVLVAEKQLAASDVDAEVARVRDRLLQHFGRRLAK